MLFYSYDAMQEATEKAGPFIELQYCKAKQSTKLKKLVSVNSQKFKEESSLYVSSDDMYIFLDRYGEIFQNGIYNNLKSGIVDLFGINYYPPSQMKEIIEKLERTKPEDYLILSEWLKHGMNYNGFYILGI